MCTRQYNLDNSEPLEKCNYAELLQSRFEPDGLQDLSCTGSERHAGMHRRFILVSPIDRPEEGTDPTIAYRDLRYVVTYIEGSRTKGMDEY